MREVVLTRKGLALGRHTFTVDVEEMKVEYAGCGSHQMEVTMTVDKSEAIALLQRLVDAFPELTWREEEEEEGT